MSSILTGLIEEAGSIAIAGHVRPDGDCVGAVTGLYNYIKDNWPDKETDIYLEDFADVYLYAPGAEKARHTIRKDKIYDLFVILDVSDKERIGVAGEYLGTAKKTICIDHHISNSGVAQTDYIRSDMSSASEVLFTLFEEDKISKETATALYIGIICDTGCFKHSNTTRKTMETAGVLMEKGARSDVLIDAVFYSKTFMQNKLLGKCLDEAVLELGGKCIVCLVTRAMLNEFNADSKDLEGVIDQLRVTKGTEVAVLMTQIKAGEYKLSMRSNGKVDVNKVCAAYGGGGHILAAGATAHGHGADIKESFLEAIGAQFN